MVSSFLITHTLQFLIPMLPYSSFVLRGMKAFWDGIPALSYCSWSEWSTVLPSAQQGAKLVPGVEESGGRKWHLWWSWQYPQPMVLIVPGPTQMAVWNWQFWKCSSKWIVKEQSKFCCRSENITEVLKIPVHPSLKLVHGLGSVRLRDELCDLKWFFFST